MQVSIATYGSRIPQLETTSREIGKKLRASDPLRLRNDFWAMAEEGIISLPISPEIVILDKVRSSSERKPIASTSGATKQLDPLRASTGNFNNGGRKFSSGKPIPLISGSKPVPNYLRASTGSCHDFCKYGIKHEKEVKPWQTKSRKVKNQNDPKPGDLLEKAANLVTPTSPPVSKSNSPSPSTILENKISSQSNELAITSQSVSTKVDKAVNGKMKKNVAEKQNTPVFRGKREGDSGFAVKSRLVSAKEKKNNIIEKINTQVSASRREGEIKPDKTKLSSKEAIDVVLSSKSHTNGSKKSASTLKDQNKIKTGYKHITNNTLEVNSEHGIEVEDKETTVDGREKKHEGIKEVENVFIENEKVTIDIPLSGSRLSLNIPSYCEEETQFEPVYTNIEKKVPEFEENESTFDSLPSPNSSSQVKSPPFSCGEEFDTETDGSNDSISESSEILNSDIEETSVGNVNSEILNSGKNDVATKLKFKRGKIVKIESNNSGPRRLRFRRGKVLDENQDKNVKNCRRSFARVGIDDDTDDKNGDSEKVVLRHQEVEGKKDAQGLFNNVIEETANKLVEMRKSKVKALVGAFETVISLQVAKPPTKSDFSER